MAYRQFPYNDGKNIDDESPLGCSDNDAGARAAGLTANGAAAMLEMEPADMARDASLAQLSHQ